MPLFILRLENRILFDAAAHAVIAQVVGAQGAESNAAGGDHHTAAASATADATSDTAHSADSSSHDSSAHSLVEAVPAAPPANQVNLLLVASNVENAQQLANATSKDVTVVVYDYNNTTLPRLQQIIAEALNGRQATSIAFATEGETGLFFLTKDFAVSADTLTANSDLAGFWKGVGDELAPDGRVDLLGCDVAGSQGNNFGLISNLEGLLDSNGGDHLVAASTNPTGNKVGADWVLEAGNIDASTYFDMSKLSQWDFNLNTFTVINANSSGAGSLQQAIFDANANPGSDTINFTISATSVITLATTSVTGTTIIDATGATGYGFGSQMVTLTNTQNTLALSANVIVRGLHFTGSTSNFVELFMTTGTTEVDHCFFDGGFAGILVSGGTSNIHDSYFGTNISGTAAGNSLAIGIQINGGTNNIIQRNTISDNGFEEILYGAGNGLTLDSNFIGLDKNGATSIGTATYGISVRNSATGTLTITNNGFVSSTNGIDLNAAGITANIYSNYIGTNITSTTAYANTNGIIVHQGIASIGDGTDAHRNFISGNSTFGIEVVGGTTVNILDNFIGVNSANNGTFASRGIGIEVTAGSPTIDNNVISGNTNGIQLDGGTTTITNNKIGTNASNAVNMANQNGVVVNGGTTTIGGALAATRNIISGNTSEGVWIKGGTANVFANYIGLNNAGGAALANGADGVLVAGGTNSIIGGAGLERNIISGNASNGIELSGGTGTLVQNNYISLDQAGTTIVQNGLNAILVDGGSGTIGGSIAGGLGNVISGQTAGNGVGIEIDSGSVNVQGNLIGTSTAGTAALGNTTGIKITSSTASTIGNGTADTVNTISGNTTGIWITNGSSIITDNYIGTNKNGSGTVANTTGILVSGGSPIIGVAGALPNIISANTTNGIELSGGSGTTIQNNYIGLILSGASADANGQNGILVDGGIATIGGLISAGAANVISGQSLGNGAGIEIDSGSVNVKGNLIGTNIAGTAAIANKIGINITATSTSTIGGGTLDTVNTISGNTTGGIAISNGTQIVQGNYIGIRSAGANALANAGPGINITGGSNHQIGVAGQLANVISGNSGANGNGITLTGSSGTKIRNNTIGLNAAGTAAIANAQNGILVNGATGVIIGGNQTTGEGNTISDNTQSGIQVTSGTVTSIQGNYIGVGTAGTGALGNKANGINLTTGTGVLIGGDNTSGQGNVISDNTTTGITVSGSATALIEGNLIGTNATGTAAIASGVQTGILISSSGSSTIGGTTTNFQNTVSGNGTGISITNGTQTVEGNYVGINLAGAAAIANTGGGIIISGGTNHVIGSTSAPANVISGNSGANGNGIALTASSGTMIENNIIGLNAAGAAAIANAQNGILINGATGVVIGGNASVAGNVITTALNTISGNTLSGIQITSGTVSLIQGNFIGTDVGGTLALGNKTNGINVTTGTAVLIGGDLTLGQANVISDNTTSGINISGSATALVEGNLIGLNKSGSAAVASGVSTGIIISSTGSSTVGGTTANVQNTISGNITGITISNGTQTIEGNYIGLNSAGTAAVGNVGAGISITGGTNHVIGSTAALANVISGNSGANGNGISLTASSGTLIENNIIGLNAAGNAAVTNARNGILINGATGVVIGGNASVAGNVITNPLNTISGNTLAGIQITTGTVSLIQGNFIGTDTGGTLALGNKTSGIAVSVGTGVLIGGDLSLGQANVISDNTTSGITISGTATALVEGNLIGLTKSGSAAVASGVSTGIIISSTGASTVGGSTSNFQNTISGNITGISITNGSQTVEGNYIGTDTGGSFAVQNTTNGISITGGANHVIGGIGSLGNLISGNTTSGITISGTATAAIQGNYIGTNKTGLNAIGNGTGIIDTATAANTIGGVSTFTGAAPLGQGNLISGNNIGISLSGGSQSVFGNLIGTDITGAAALGNTTSGISMTAGIGYIIGATTTGELNIISGNTTGISITGNGQASVQANYIGTDYTGMNAVANTTGISISSTRANTIGGDSTLGGTVPLGQGNLISGNTTGIALSGGSQNVFGNLIGTNITGAAALGNTTGINITASTVHNIGGISTGQRNVISGNTGNGISISGTATALVEANLIGTNYLGLGAVANNNGIVITSTAASTIGGVVAADLNVISGNTASGVVLSAGTQKIFGNYIGTDINAANPLSNANGVVVTAGTNQNIGGAVAGERNIISGNSNAGVLLQGGSALVVGNVIGTNLTDATNMGNKFGVQITGGTSTIGGNSAAELNVISANTVGGISVTAGSSNIEGNYIGLNNAGSGALGNATYGIQVSGGAGTLIGGTVAQRNYISGNITNGIELTGGTGVLVESNYIGWNAAGLLTIANGSNGVLINAGNATIGGAISTGNANFISGNTANGIEIDGGTVTVQGNEIGTNIAGNAAAGNVIGIAITGGTATIGGGTVNLRNTISGNTTGVSITGGTPTLSGNYIGTDLSGAAVVANTTNGVSVSGTANAIIGVATATIGNIISGNTNAGVFISAGTATIVANQIGTNTTNSAIIGNAYGIQQTGGTSTIGGAAANTKNVISANTIDGIWISGGTSNVFASYIGLNNAGTAALANGADGILISGGTNNVIGGAGLEQNLISGNTTNGIELSGGTGAQIQNNFIGINKAGTGAVPNGQNGILVDGGAGSIGGSIAAGLGNVISGNTGNGIELDSGSVSVTGNLIGTNSAGTGARGNTIGINITATTSFTIGGGTADLVNTISGNSTGIAISNGTQTIDGNYIGLNKSGAGAVANTGSGISITGGSNHVIGVAGDIANVISGNGGNGISLTNSGGTIVRNNYIGLNAAGATAIANVLNGVLVNGATNVTIGGAATGQRNTISGNTLSGIQITSGSVLPIQGNYIGTDIGGTLARGNKTNGITVSSGTNVLIGGDSSLGQGNVISDNTTSGITVSGAATATIEGNIIGLNATGSAAVASGVGTGVIISSTGSSTVGGTSANFRNIISGNNVGISITNGNQTIEGNYIGTDITGALDTGNTAQGIVINGGPSSILNNVISGNNSYGIWALNTSGNTIQGNEIGTTALGSAALSNLSFGIFLQTSSNNLIGGTTAAQRNVISANGVSGSPLSSDGIFDSGGSGNVIEGNYIGVSADGTIALGNFGRGIEKDNGSNETITNNVISANADDGIFLFTTNGNTVQGNYIGISADGTTAMGNGLDGILLNLSTNNLIGGSSSGQGNVISGNLQSGIDLALSSVATIQGNYIGTDATGSYALANPIGIVTSGATTTIGGDSTAGEGNLISGNGIGIEARGTTFIYGNLIGTDATGTSAVANTTGITFTTPISVTIGGTGTGQRNIISGNSTGISFSAGSATIQNNIIGLQIDGSSLLGNTVAGINISSSSTSTIGGTSAAERNIISGNGIGIILSAGTQTVEGNYIGTDSSGTLNRGNTGDGIDINGGTNHVINSNVISGNNGNGIKLNGGDGTMIQDNRIGTTADGVNALGNALNGILINSGDNIQIGGSSAGEGNIISGNTGNGIEIDGGAGAIVYGNIIGQNINLTQLSNQGDGVNFTSAGQRDALIGGIAAGQANVIANNVGEGVRVDAANGVTIRGNSIYDNGDAPALGINLGGIPIGNDDQQPPTLDGVQYDPATNQTTIHGTFTGTIGTQYVLDFYANPPDNGLGIEGKTWVGQSNLIAGTGVAAAYTVILTGYIPTGPTYFTATATVASSAPFNTSEFSGPHSVSAISIVNSPATVNEGGTVLIKMSNLNATDLGLNPSQLVYTITALPTHGMLFKNNVLLTVNSTFTQADINNNIIGYTQNLNPVAGDNFTFNVTDSNGGILNGQVFDIVIILNASAEPQSLAHKLIPYNEELIPTNPNFNFRFHGNGFFDVAGQNQLTSFGTNMGYGFLVGNGDRSLSFNLVNGEPQLSNASRDLGYGPAVNALDYVIKYAGFTTDTPYIQQQIESLAESTKGFKLNQTNTLASDVKLFSHSGKRWEK